MKNRTFSFEVPPQLVSKTSTAVGEYYRSEFGKDYPQPAIEAALRTWLDRKVDVVLEEMPERLTSPGSGDSLEFARILRATVEGELVLVEEAATQLAPEIHPVFTGNRTFSPERLTAMMAYLARRSVDVYKTKLNKLLFYADLTGYYLTGQGMSGVQYVHLPHGPVPDRFEELIDLGVRSKKINVTTVPGKGENVRLIRPGENAATELTQKDQRILDWVIETYGHLSTNDISDRSHEEMAYKFTGTGEPIAYRYAQFLKMLPPKDLLSDTPS